MGPTTPTLGMQAGVTAGKPPSTPKMPGSSGLRTGPIPQQGSQINPAAPGPAPMPSVPSAPTPPTAPRPTELKLASSRYFMPASPLNLDALVAQALSAGVHRAKVAAECDDDDHDDDKKKKDKPRSESEEKKAAYARDLTLADHAIKVAAYLKGASEAAVPTSAVSAPSKGYPENFGKGKQQVPDTNIESGKMPVKDVSESATKSAGARLHQRLKQANAAATPTSEVSQGSGQSSPGAIGSNEALINLTPAQARDASEKRKNLAQVFKEPALTSATEKTLDAAFEHTQGNKLASAQTLFARLQESVR